MITALIILSIALLAVCYFAYITYIKYKKVLTYAESLVQYNETYIQFISAMWFKFKHTKKYMEEIDRKGAFRADDEVGHTFTALQECIDDLYEFITTYVNKEEETKKS